MKKMLSLALLMFSAFVCAEKKVTVINNSAFTLYSHPVPPKVKGVQDAPSQGGMVKAHPEKSKVTIPIKQDNYTRILFGGSAGKHYADIEFKLPKKKNYDITIVISGDKELKIENIGTSEGPPVFEK